MEKIKSELNRCWGDNESDQLNLRIFFHYQKEKKKIRLTVLWMVELSRRPSKSSIDCFIFLTVIYQTDTKFVLSTIDASDTMVDDSPHNLSFSFHLIYSIWSWVLTRERHGINITLYQLSLQREQQGFSGNNKPFKYDRGNGTLGGL